MHACMNAIEKKQGDNECEEPYFLNQY
jgi:hypothetical protein